MDDTDRCPFCPPRLDHSLVRVENDLCLFLQPPAEVLVGSGIIVPRVHRQSPFELTPDEWHATRELLQHAKQLLDAEHHPHGYNVGWNCGSVAGQEVVHTHLHIIPRFADEPLAGKGIRYWLKQKSNRRP